MSYEEITKGDVVVVFGTWCDLVTVEKVEGEKIYFTSGDYVDLNKVRRAEPEEVEVGCKLF